MVVEIDDGLNVYGIDFHSPVPSGNVSNDMEARLRKLHEIYETMFRRSGAST